MFESLNYGFRNPKNIIWVIYPSNSWEIKKKNHGFLRGPQLDKQRWRARLGILTVNKESFFPLMSPTLFNFDICVLRVVCCLEIFQQNFFIHILFS